MTPRNSSSTAVATTAAAVALSPGALSAVNPASAKAAMLYVLRGPMWNVHEAGDVSSYGGSLVAAQNGAAAATPATALRHHLASSDPRESS